MKIYLGPAGSPSASTLEGLSAVKEMGLNAMEVEFVRGVHMKPDLAREIGEKNRKAGLFLSVHAPYFINLASPEKEKVKASMKRILDSCERGHYMGAKFIVFHPAYFGKLDKEKCFEAVKQRVEEMNETIRSNKWNVSLAPETTGKHSAFGSLDETIRLAKEAKTSICLDLAHLYARNMGVIDYSEVLDRVGALRLKQLHCHFSGIQFSLKGERNHIVMGESPPFEPFAKELLKRDMDVSIISESPVTYQDSLRMKRIFEKLGHRVQ